MKTIQRPGACVAYDVQGSGPAILLGHSFLCDGRMWSGVANALAERYTVINVDARGHRHSTAEEPFTLWDLAADWRAVLDAERIERAAAVGLSMGGMTAMRMALHHPDRVAALGILDSSADPETPPNRVQYRLMSEIVRNVPLAMRAFAPIVERKFFCPATRVTEPEVVKRQMEQSMAHDMRQIYRASRAVFDRETILPRLPAIRCPALVLVGAEDVSTPPSRSERIAAAIPGARLGRITGAGHLSTLEQPEAVAGALLDFLDDVWAPSRPAARYGT